MSVVELFRQVIGCQYMDFELFEYRPTIYGSSLPVTEQDVKRILDAGVKLVISLETSYPLPEFERLGIEHQRLPIKDYGIPDTQTIRRFITILRRAVDDERRVLVHCYGGCGRTGTMLALAEIYIFGARDGPSVIRTVRAVRPCAIETVEQEHLVLRHARHPIQDLR